MTSRTVEIGHTYAPDLLVPQTNLGANYEFGDTPQASLLRAIAKSIGTDTLRVALIDDVAARERQKHSQDKWRWQMFINRSEASVRTGTLAELVAFESNYESRARKLTEEIKTMDLPPDYRLSEDAKTLLVGAGKGKVRIPLQGFKGIEDPTYPSCQVLDLAWLEHRLALAPEAVTILPSSYEAQQEQVRLLAELLPHLQEKSATNIFIN